MLDSQELKLFQWFGIEGQKTECILEMEILHNKHNVIFTDSKYLVSIALFKT